MGRDRRAADAPLEGRPSGVAGHRLARRLRSDVADVRVRLEEAVLRSDALLASGQPERAAAVLDEQHALLAELRETLSSSVAAAMVEAEAETVLAGAPDGDALFGADAVPPTPEPEPRRSLRATASALASAVAALALLIVAAPTPSPGTLAAADRADASDAGADADPGEHGSSDTADAATDPADTDQRAIGPNELEVRRLFASPSPLPDRHDDRREGEGVVQAGLHQFQALVDSFVATVVRAAGGLAPATLTELDEVAPATTSEPATGTVERPVRRAPAADRPATPPVTPAVPEDPEDAPVEEPAAEPAEDERSSDPALELPSEDGNASVPGVTELE